MEFNNRLIDTITGTYDRYISSFNRGIFPDRVNYDKNNVFQHSIIIDLNKDTFEIPIICKDYCEDAIKEMIINSSIIKYNRIIFPLYVHGNTFERRTADSIIGDFFKTVDYIDRLKKIVTNKGEIYYGGKGIILDKDMKPLLLYTIRGKFKENPTNRNYCEYLKPICRVSPLVFTNQDSLINKAIVKKIIPILTSYKSFIGASERFDGTYSEAEVIINDIDCIQAPNKPTPDKCSNEYFNAILKDNIEDILVML